MVEILMNQTRKGTQDGFKVEEFVKGQVYDVREGLARQFFAAGYATKTKNQILEDWKNDLIDEGYISSKLKIQWRKEGLSGIELKEYESLLQEWGV